MPTAAHRRHQQPFPRQAVGLEVYWAQINAVGSEPLTRAEEVVVCAQIAAGDPAARDRLVQANLRFALRIARSYEHSGVSIEDLVGAANLGLMTAVDRFDAAKGFKFITYAVWWIRQAIRKAIAEQDAVRCAHVSQQDYRDIDRARRDLDQQAGCHVSASDLAEAVGIPVSRVDEALRTRTRTASLNSPISQDDDDRPFLELLGAEDEELDLDVDLLEAGIARLSKRHQRILRCTYIERLNLSEIGELIGVTRERVRQLRDEALAVLRRDPDVRTWASAHTDLAATDEQLRSRLRAGESRRVLAREYGVTRSALKALA